jgi:uncharacterized protein (TIGR00730 family)
MKRVTVFCGSSSGNEKIFIETAFLVGQALAAKSIGVVYGGARIGLMGAVADGALSGSGEVIGVLPRFLRTKEIEHAGLSKLYLVESMHERKAKMNELCDGIIALPGGFGTLEELFEMLTWAQLGLHAKPVGLLNVSGFYDGLAEVLQNMVNKGFLKESNRRMLITENNIDTLLEKMTTYEPPQVPKWITASKT